MIKIQSSGFKFQGLGVKTFNLRVSVWGWKLDILNAGLEAEDFACGISLQAVQFRVHGFRLGAQKFKACGAKLKS